MLMQAWSFVGTAQPYFLRRTLSYRAAAPLLEQRCVGRLRVARHAHGALSVSHVRRGVQLSLSVEDVASDTLSPCSTVFAALCDVRSGSAADASVRTC
jgi:hypothetical protein